MCGIVGAVAQRDIVPILIEGLRRLEYRGYDSAGLAIINPQQELLRRRALGKVSSLVETIDAKPLQGNTGIAHTRWATHGIPSENNAHPHLSMDDLAVVHNGIIENHDVFRNRLIESGYEFASETDTEIVAHLVHFYCTELGKDFLTAVQSANAELEGAFALVFMLKKEPQRLIAVRRGSPVVIGVGIGEYFVASDQLALLPVTQRFIYLEEGDIADIRCDKVTIYNAKGVPVERKIHTTDVSNQRASRGKYRHYMLKEIHEQPQAVMDTLEGRMTRHKILDEVFGAQAVQLFKQVERVRIVACGTSYHAGLVARYWLEGLTGISCQVEIASEICYRRPVVEANTLFVTLSQSGETADTLAALRAAKGKGYLGFLTICNVPQSSLVRESDFALMTRAGPEIGVASTKAFTTQLTALLLLTVALGRHHQLTAEIETQIVTQLHSLPKLIEQALAFESDIKTLATRIAERQHALFLGRGQLYPIAAEGALKLKEISYIHAEAYPAGELKHGPLALVDNNMPVVAILPNDAVLDKLKSNLEQVRARGGELLIITDETTQLETHMAGYLLQLPAVPNLVAPIVYSIPLQLLAYYVAILKGTDVDQPRNLAKSVTVE